MRHYKVVNQRQLKKQIRDLKYSEKKLIDDLAKTSERIITYQNILVENKIKDPFKINVLSFTCTPFKKEKV